MEAIPVSWERADDRPIWLFAVGVLLSLIVFTRLLFDPDLGHVPASNQEHLILGLLIIIPLSYLCGKSIFLRRGLGMPRSLTYLFLFALLFRLTWATVMYVWSVGVGREGPIASDDLQYFQVGEIFAAAIREGLWPKVITYGGYYSFNTAVNLISNGNYFITQAINSLLGAITIIYIYRLSDVIYGERVALWAAILAATSPELAMWSAANLKDAQIILCITVSTFYLVIMARSYQFPRGTAALFCLVTMYLVFLRPVFAAFSLVMGGAYLLICRPGILNFRSIGRMLGAVIVFATVLFYTGYFPGGENYEKLLKYKAATEVLEASYASGSLAAVTSPERMWEAPYLLVPALGYSLITPFPFWKLEVNPDSAEDLLALPGVLFWYIIIIPAFYGGIVSVRRDWKAALPLIAWALFIWIAVALISGGAIYRYRTPMLPFVFAFAAVGLAEPRRWLGLIPLYIFGLGTLCIIYLLVKS